MISHPHRRVEREFSMVSRGYTAAQARRDYRENREVLGWLPACPSDRVLDAACGAGMLARALAPRVRRVFGLDLCGSMIERGRALRSPGASEPAFAMGTVTQLPFRDRTFDLLTCSYAFANLPDPHQALAEFARVIRPRGRIAIIEIVAPDEPLRRAYLNRLERLRGGLPTKILSVHEFVALFHKAGLRVASLRLRRRRRTGREWLGQSPAAADRQRARQLRRMLADSITGDQAGLHPRHARGDIVFYHRTAWFLLRLGPGARQRNQRRRRSRL